MIIHTYETKEGLIKSNLQDDLNTILRRASPEFQVEIVPVSGKLKDSIETFMISLASLDLSINPICRLSYHLGKCFDLNTVHDRVLILVEEMSELSKICKIIEPKALYGCSNEFISVEYSPENFREVTQLHECLHFFGVNDCYEKDGNPKSSCTNNECFMQYGVASRVVCDDVIEQLKKFAKNYKPKYL